MRAARQELVATFVASPPMGRGNPLEKLLSDGFKVTRITTPSASENALSFVSGAYGIHLPISV
jgi:hypothetical protein